MKALAMALALLIAAGTGWADAPAATSAPASTEEAAAVVSDDSVSLDGNLQKKCAEAGVAWGGYTKSFDCRPLAKTVATQYDAYKTARIKAEASESTEDWSAASDLAVYTYVKGHIYNRIARNLKNGAQTRGTLKAKKGTVEGISKIDREALKSSIEWYTKAKAAGTLATNVSTDTEDRDAQSKEAGEGIVSQAEGNITWIQSLLDDPVFGTDGANKWAVGTTASDEE